MEEKQIEIMRVYETICKESLSTPIGKKPSFLSRINDDGLPFQIALSLGSHPNTLKFLSEVCIPGSSNLDRIMLSRNRIKILASLLCQESTEQMAFLLNRMAPTDDPTLIADPAGAYWIGVRFSEKTSPTLQVYINAKWGTEPKMWERLDEFAKFFNNYEEWSAAKSLFTNGMKPLGMLITAQRDLPLGGRIYLSSHDSPLSYYEDMIRSFTNGACNELFQQFLDIFLPRTSEYPMKFIVCSFGIGCDLVPKFKFEICGHCIFKSDNDALDKCLYWAKVTKVDPKIYFRVLKIISGGNISTTKNNVHKFFGIGFHDNKVDSSIYLKPNLPGWNEI